MSEELNIDRLKEANLQDIQGSSVQEQLGDLKGHTSRFCDVEYGVSREDGRLVFHFFPPGWAANDKADWADWHAFRDRLEKAIMQTFTLETIDAGYAEELKSFYLLANHPGVIDMSTFIARFFERIETEA